MIDKILLIVGTISALIAGGIYQLMFLIYGNVAGVLVDYQTFRQGTTTTITNKSKFPKMAISSFYVEMKIVFIFIKVLNGWLASLDMKVICG